MWPPPPPIKLKMLIAIAILPLLLFYTKQTWAQEKPTEPSGQQGQQPANGMPQTYGLGEYAMDDNEQVMVPGDAKLLDTDDDVKNYKAKNADKQFKPCMMEINKDNKFQLVYDEDAAKDGCTVDLVIGPSEDEKTFNVKMVLADPVSCLDDCGEKTFDNELVAGSANLFPFTYSLSNEQFEKLHNGPPYKEDQKCFPTCQQYGGKCMASATSLQLIWNTCDAKVKARIQLVGEPNSAWPGEQEAKDKEVAIGLVIAKGKNPTVTMQIEGQTTSTFPNVNGKPATPACFIGVKKMALIPELKFWAIKSGNTEINGKHLLVFHFLPQTATRIFDKEGKLQDPPGPEMPKCKGKLAIAFENVVGLLQSPTGQTITGATLPTNGGATGPTTNETMESTTNETMESTTSETAESKSNLVIIIACVAGGVVVLLIIVGVLVWCFCCRDKEDNGEDAETGADTEKEIVKEGAEDVPNSSE